MPREIDVAIIGAGASGIAAARRLAQTGYSFVVLEAADRVGGRAWTVEAASHPLDLGCGWLHSADRNAWTHHAERLGLEVNRRAPAWASQYQDLGFTRPQQRQARAALHEWERRLSDVARTSDRASDALDAESPWAAHVEAFCAFGHGVSPDRMSARDYLAYAGMCSYQNWRIESGLGRLIASSLPAGTALHLATAVKAIAERARGLRLETARGDIDARTAILTVSTNVLAGSAIRLPAALDPWRHAAGDLPLGHNEKLFLQVNDPLFIAETHLLGEPNCALTCDFYIRPFSWPVIECFFGGQSARVAADNGQSAAFALAIDQLVALFGSAVRRKLKPVVGSDWGRSSFVGGAYSCALPGRSAARGRLSEPWNDKLFFAGEATSAFDFATAHGAHDSGVRAASEAIALLDQREALALRQKHPPR
jgi:monoamine oxidase